jgi:hypothetical protein
VLLPKMDQIMAFIGRIFDQASASAEVGVSTTPEPLILVRADASRPGLAVSVADLLQRRGYDARVEDYRVQIESEGTFIASRRESVETALLIGGLLRVGPEFVMLDPSVQEGTDIVVTLGRGYVVPE